MTGQAVTGRAVPSGTPPARSLPLRLTPTRRGWGVLLLALAAWGTWIMLGLADVRLLVVLLAVPVPLSHVAMGTLALLHRPRVSLEEGPPTVSVGDEVVVGVQVRVPSPLRSTTWVVWSTGRPGTPGSVTDFRRTPLDGARSEIALQARRRGPLDVSPVALSMTDPLGLVQLHLRLHESSRVLVLPSLVPLEGLPDALNDLGTRGSRVGAGEPGGSLRDYRRGDAPRTIHWKQSARQGHLLVNLPEAGGGTKHRVALVTEADAYPRGAHRPGKEAGGANPDFELAVSVAATLVTHWCAAGAEVTLDPGAPDGHVDTGTDAGAHLRDLAEADLRRAADASRASGGARRPVPDADRGGVVVTGWVTPGVRRKLRGRGPGIVVLTSGLSGPDAHDLPGGWATVVVGRDEGGADPHG